jgi:hypothetical protein
VVKQLIHWPVHPLTFTGDHLAWATACEGRDLVIRVVGRSAHEGRQVWPRGGFSAFASVPAPRAQGRLREWGHVGVGFVEPP